MSKVITRALVLALTVAGISVSAAEFSINVTFNDGGVGSGTFTTDSAFRNITSWSFTLSGSSTPSHNFTSSTNSGQAILQTAPPPTNGCGSDPQELTFANAGFISYSTICLSSAISASGGTIDLPNTLDCDGSCGTATSGKILPFTALISYSANLHAGDSHVNLTNVGTVNGFDPAGDICANVYVFADDQQLIACCTCQLTPNHLQTLSARNDLINNMLTPGTPNDITTMLVTTFGVCDAVNPGPMAEGLRAWGTTLHAAPGGGYAVTETPFSSVALSDSEFSKMTQFCGFIHADGSGYGICGSCTLGAAGASKQ